MTAKRLKGLTLASMGYDGAWEGETMALQVNLPEGVTLDDLNIQIVGPPLILATVIGPPYVSLYWAAWTDSREALPEPIIAPRLDRSADQ